jgi:POT family proton-dependent oligopeptide transporter
LPKGHAKESPEILSEKSQDDSSLEGNLPTAEERATLRHIPESLPARIWLVAFVEFCERFTYYGMQGLFQNYVSHAKDGSDGQKGLGTFAA